MVKEALKQGTFQVGLALGGITLMLVGAFSGGNIGIVVFLVGLVLIVSSKKV